MFLLILVSLGQSLSKCMICGLDDGVSESRHNLGERCYIIWSRSLLTYSDTPEGRGSCFIEPLDLDQFWADPKHR